MIAGQAASDRLAAPRRDSGEGRQPRRGGQAGRRLSAYRLPRLGAGASGRALRRASGDQRGEISRAQSAWRPRPESNRGARICSPLRNHSATRPSAGRRCGEPVTAYNHMPRPAATQSGYANAIVTGKPPRSIFLAQHGRKGVAPAEPRGYTRPPIPDSSAVEQSTVNRLVAGSNPAPGANNFKGLGAKRLGPFRLLGTRSARACPLNW